MYIQKHWNLQYLNTVFPILKLQIVVKCCIKLFQDHLNIFITKIIKF